MFEDRRVKYFGYLILEKDLEYLCYNNPCRGNFFNLLQSHSYTIESALAQGLPRQLVHAGRSQIIMHMVVGFIFGLVIICT